VQIYNVAKVSVHNAHILLHCGDSEVVVVRWLLGYWHQTVGAKRPASLMSPLVDEERMRPVPWLGRVSQ